MFPRTRIWLAADFELCSICEVGVCDPSVWSVTCSWYFSLYEGTAFHAVAMSVNSLWYSSCHRVSMFPPGVKLVCSLVIIPVRGKSLHSGVRPGIKLEPFGLVLVHSHFVDIDTGIRSLPFVPVIGLCDFIGVHPGIPLVPVWSVESMYPAILPSHPNSTLVALPLEMLFFHWWSVHLQGCSHSFITSLHSYPYWLVGIFPTNWYSSFQTETAFGLHLW